MPRNLKAEPQKNIHDNGIRYTVTYIDQVACHDS